VNRVAVLPDLAPASYARHPQHAEDRLFFEKNCYIDIWIEVVHALGCEPLAMMPFVLPVDFLGDQWTFFKPSHDEIRQLYGIDTQELTVWRPLTEHAVEHFADGRLISTEADSFYLPDTQATDYKRNHVKTTIVLNDIDFAAKRLGYFHSAGYHAAEGEDFDRLLRIDAPPDPTYLPFFAETITTRAVIHRPLPELKAMSRRLLSAHLAKRPAENPVTRFGKRFARDLPWLTEKGLPFYHAWAFATARQLGAAFELAAGNLRWLGDEAMKPAAEAFEQLASGAKTFILKGARAVNARRALDASPMFEDMARAWQRGMDVLVGLESAGSPAHNTDP
jgi:hypothetical protein